MVGESEADLGLVVMVAAAVDGLVGEPCTVDSRSFFLCLRDSASEVSENRSGSLSLRLREEDDDDC